MTALPAPTGPWPVGRVLFDWTDTERVDPYARQRDERRRLAVWAWYPAAGPGAGPGAAPPAGPPAARDRYLPGWWRLTGAFMGFRPGAVRIHAVRDAPPAHDGGRWPVVVFSPSGNPPLLYSALLEELASHGYAVVGISHTYETVPVSVLADGKVRLLRTASVGGALGKPGARPYEQDLAERAAVVDVKADDITFVLDRLVRLDGGPLAGRLDLAAVGVAGHSFGGGAAAEACRRDERFRAGVSLDGGLWRRAEDAAVDRPFLQVFGRHEEYCATDRAVTVGAWQALHDNARPGRSVLVRDALHASFFDAPMLPLLRYSPLRRLCGAMGPGAHRTIADHLLAFLGRHLRGEPAPAGAGADPRVVTAPPAELFRPVPRTSPSGR
jgi:dienelactone hydrolase